MSDKKNDNYDLYTEHIVKEPWKNSKRILKKGASLVAMAVFFGLVAGLVMIIVYKTGKNYLDDNKAAMNETTPSTDGSESKETDPEDTTVPPIEEITTEIPSTVPIDNEKLNDYMGYYKALKSVADKAGLSVVTVTAAKQGVDFFNSTYQNIADEYGIVISSDSTGYYILTEYSLVKNSENIQVTYYDKTVDTAEFVAGDTTTDMAVIKTGSLNTAVVPVQFGNSDAVLKGDLLVATGKLYGFNGTIGYGIATGVNNSVNDTDSIYRLINTDISGTATSNGVILNLHGEVVGIITMAYNSDNTNFITAYAINDVRNLMQNLVNKKSMPYLGIKGQTVTDEIAATNKIPKGIYISAVETNSPAYKSGIQSGDVITQINGTEINNMESFMMQLEKNNPGDNVNVTIKRRGREDYKEIEFNLVLGVE
ncbi:S1C family serine protease [Eshraghiella crossota]|jgi:S1-C subfamily serine protease|uniref:PDZ/DHR/GLGF domain protein n=1 Tax=Eshraghiella crossota DSM 2876 TaxID=511680 RepID=D4RY42_9FIRM|nr:PDZ domain-containing protein [Butyrivibrio crossotus]EFF68942.1 PDZ/DHR/GLGF domain protein [Butyrivibrio crossotus DSM 2876]UWO50942.1 S1C family serine protease [Butyrivibrio crossotus]